MRGQISIEFLLLLLLTLLMAQMLSASFLSQREEAMALERKTQQAIEAHEAARAMEAWRNSGMEMGFDDHDRAGAFRIQGGKLIMDHDGGRIEAGGLFHGSAKEAE